MPLRLALKLWPLAVLCLLIATRWMFTNAWPNTASTVSSQTVAATLAAALCLVLTRRPQISSSPTQRRELWQVAVAGALLFAGMNSAVLAGSASPRGNDLLLALSLVPAVVAVASAAGSNAGLTGLDVAPGLLAPAGLLLLYSQPAFRSAGEDIVMLATPLCAGLGAAWLATSSEVPLTALRSALACAGAAVVFGIATLFSHSRPALPSISATAYDLAIYLATLLTLSRLGIQRFSAQFVLVPLLLLLEGLAIVQIRPSGTQLGGLAMLVAALLLLLRSRESPQRENTALFS